MQTRALTLLLLPLALACGTRGTGGARDSAAGPDTAAILGTGTAPVPAPAAVDSARKAGDSVGARKRP